VSIMNGSLGGGRNGAGKPVPKWLWFVVPAVLALSCCGGFSMLAQLVGSDRQADALATTSTATPGRSASATPSVSATPTVAAAATVPAIAAPPPTTSKPTTAKPTTSKAKSTTSKPASQCHPSYVGACVPVGVKDVDCAGGSGDGPYYVKGPIRVVGPDVYKLDADKDGLACE
jgi:hypothetical protein